MSSNTNNSSIQQTERTPLLLGNQNQQSSEQGPSSSSTSSRRPFFRDRFRRQETDSPSLAQPQVNGLNQGSVVSSSTFLDSTPLMSEHGLVTSREDDSDDDDKSVSIEEDHNVLNAGFESLDYEISDNLLFQNSERIRSASIYKLYWLECRRWIICFLIGILTGLTAGLIDFGVENLSDVKFSSVKNLVDKCVDDGCIWAPQFVWLVFNAGLVMIGGLLTAFVEPVAAGSGIPQIKCYLNGVIVPHVVRIKTLITKVVGVVCAVAGGLAVGKEGPMIHSGAVIAAGVSQGRTTSLNLDFKIFQAFRSDREKRDFVSAGAAAGVSAAFGAPVGGVLFSLEEGASFWNQALVWRIFFASMTSTMTLNIVQSYIKGHPWELSYAGLINFGTFENVNYQFYELFFVVLMGIFGGFSGAVFNFINLKLSKFRMQYVRKRWLQVIEAMMVAAFTGLFAWDLIFYKNDCKPISEKEDSLQVQFFCNDGEYSSTARLFFDTPEATVRNLFHSAPGTYQALTLVIFAGGYFFLACWTYGLTVPSGLFIPSLLVGAAWGRLVGILLASIGSNASWVSLSFYSLVGASAQLGGIVRMTISLTVILMEATSNVPLGLPVMISLIAAKLFGDLFNEGIYDMHIHLQGVPILGWEPIPMTVGLNAKAVMSHPVTVFRMVESVDRIVKVLRDTDHNHNGFPVVEDYDPSDPEVMDGCETFGTFKGLILRSQLIMMLKRKLFQENPEINNIINNLGLADFNECYPRYMSIKKISITAEEKNFTMNLQPFINQSHYVVRQTASYYSLFNKFRSLGLRHMVVINDSNKVIGMVTRKDLARYETSVQQGLVSVQERPIVQ